VVFVASFQHCCLWFFYNSCNFDNEELQQQLHLRQWGALTTLTKLEPFGNGKFVGLTNIIVDRNVLIDAYDKIKSRPSNMSGQWAGWNFGWKILTKVALVIHCAVLKTERTSLGRLNVLWFPSPKNLMKRDL
jgi:hypothetical protein